MRGPKPKYRIELTTEEEKELRRLVRSRKSPQVKAKRAEPQAFLARARPVLRLYERAKDPLQSGVWIVCVDKKDLHTGSQEAPAA